MAVRARDDAPKRPLGLDLLAMIAVITGLQLLGSGLALLEYRSALEGDAEGLVSVTGFLFAFLGFSYLLLALGYLRGSEKAGRRGRGITAFAIVFAVLGAWFMRDPLSPDSPVWTVLFNAVVFVYLGRPKVRACFARRSRG